MAQAGNRELLHLLVNTITKRGMKGDSVVSNVNARLAHKYGVPNPIQIAIEALKPSLIYRRDKVRRRYLPMPLYSHVSSGIAIRWLVRSARERLFGGRPIIERGLYSEIDSLIQGRSSLYTKKFQTHRNPN